MEESIMTKKCSKCGRELPYEQFSKCKSNPDGLQYMCKECTSVYNKLNHEKHKSDKSEVQQHLHKVYFNPELAKFQPKDLIAELRARGYSGELSIRQTIVV